MKASHTHTHTRPTTTRPKRLQAFPLTADCSDRHFVQGRPRRCLNGERRTKTTVKNTHKAYKSITAAHRPHHSVIAGLVEYALIPYTNLLQVCVLVSNFCKGCKEQPEQLLQRERGRDRQTDRHAGRQREREKTKKKRGKDKSKTKGHNNVFFH